MTGCKPRADKIWWRIPKLVIGFSLASIIMTARASHYSFADYDSVMKAGRVGQTKTLRIWAFVFCHFSSGLTTRFRELTHIGMKRFQAITAGVLVNVADN